MRHALLMADGDTALTTLRLRLVPATRAMITAELEDPDQLGEIVDADGRLTSLKQQCGREPQTFLQAPRKVLLPATGDHAAPTSA